MKEKLKEKSVYNRMSNTITPPLLLKDWGKQEEE